MGLGMIVHPERLQGVEALKTGLSSLQGNSLSYHLNFVLTKNSVDMVQRQDGKWVALREKLEKAIRSERPGMPVMIADLRKTLPGTHPADFNQAVLDLAESGNYFLARHFHPAQSTKMELELMIPDGAGNYYIAINPREGEMGSVEKCPEATDRKSGRGGSRAGAGRPAVKTKIKRVPLSGARIPGWLMDWLKAEGDMGHMIEVALIGYYGLKPPEEAI